ncbi:hypothetical protein K491DRAFT_250189 [Lophiostoma macrostomum CBS 122681]|uniref:Transcriptional regulatory protein RXT2 N-terminal domain-containing protein n=1 Tax=Lophiostoma macrostomum CBS 122681 TaxID=1314788 RepID=A0A6A6SKK2_9PLEO|nr:hypothetical protein K491DRAFT_250189 [Lophiostoma macrostomum CBS 122681]
MAGQQQQIVDTIFNMKRRLLRKDDSSDSDESDTPYNHRLHSLKRKAQYTRSGKPESASDPPPYKKRIEHAGYQRYILQRNPLRYDPDGDIVEPADDYEDEDELSVVEEDPYADIKLEELLAPMTSAADLPNHPTLSLAYTSKHLTNLTAEAGVISRKEKDLLWRTKDLFTRFLGDAPFVPGSLDDLPSLDHLQDPWTNGSNASRTQTQNGDAVQDNGFVQETSSSNDVTMGEANQTGDAQPESVQSNGVPEVTEPAALQNGHSEPASNGDAHADSTDAPQENGDRPPAPTVEDASDTSSQHTAHRMTTRARAQAASDPSPPSSPSSTVNPIHPLFGFANDLLPDGAFGLPTSEAEDTRILLLAFIQKQEEIVRTSSDLYTGMLQGERMRQEVFKWAKAEAHVGEMSDGEDWYDREEWQLETDLVKGRDEEEDEMTTGPGKKSTRQRRTKDKEDR